MWGPVGSCWVLRDVRSTEGVLRGPEAVLRWSWGVVIFLGGPGIQGVLRNPVGLEGSWGALRVHEKSWRFEGWSYFIKGPAWPQGPFRTSRNPFDPSGPLGLLKTPYEPFNPSVTRCTHQPHRIPQDPSGPLRTTWVLSPPGTPQNPSGTIRTPKDPLSPSRYHITIC